MTRVLADAFLPLGQFVQFVQGLTAQQVLYLLAHVNKVRIESELHDHSSQLPVCRSLVLEFDIAYRIVS